MKKIIAVITMLVLLISVSPVIAEPTPINPFLDDAMFYCGDNEDCIKKQIMAAVYLGRCITEIIEPLKESPMKDIIRELLSLCIRENTNKNGMTNYIKAAECFDECIEILHKKALEHEKEKNQKEI